MPDLHHVFWDSFLRFTSAEQKLGVGTLRRATSSTGRVVGTSGDAVGNLARSTEVFSTKQATEVEEAYRLIQIGTRVGSSMRSPNLSWKSGRVKTFKSSWQMGDPGDSGVHWSVEMGRAPCQLIWRSTSSLFRKSKHHEVPAPL